MRLRRTLAVIAASIGLVAPSAAAAGQPLLTSVYATSETSGPTAALGFQRIHAAGASMVRLALDWYEVAPEQLPASWDPADPADPNYRWGELDRRVQLALKHGLTPYITILAAPGWAQSTGVRGPGLTSERPDPKQLALFARAVARRYSGSFQGLPRVRYFQIWNEQNLSIYLSPQLVKGKAVGAELYRQMLNASYDAIHGVHRDNVVISGGLAPFRDMTPSVQKQDKDWGPMSFMRSLLCLSKSLKKTCSTRVAFDVWDMHPYTSGGPTHEAYLPNDVSLGDLPDMKRALDAARRHHTIRSRGGVGFWVTEFSWDSAPPDSGAVPIRKLTMWVPEALYRMWENGVSNVTWFSLRDDSATSYIESGLYYKGKTMKRDKPKPFLKAFRFPVVAIPTGTKGRYKVWGRTPWGKRKTVVLEHFSFGRHERFATLKTDRNGIFQGTYDIGALGWLTVKIVGGERSLPYSLKPVPDHFYNPFGRPLEKDVNTGGKGS